MVRLAFYIPTMKNMKAESLRADLELGNPGMGGSEYQALLTIKNLNITSGSTEQAVLLVNDLISIDDENIPVVQVKGQDGAYDFCVKSKIDFLVLYNTYADIDKIKKYNQSTKIVIWAHNAIPIKLQELYAEIDAVYRVICVSESQYCSLARAKRFDKYLFINNGLPKGFFESVPISDLSSPQVVFIGALYPYKGVHNLLDIWRYVEKNYDGAKLLIIGSAKLYGFSNKLGRMGLADEYYEAVLERKLKRLKHPERVHFYGDMNQLEISQAVKNARVGIVNPSFYLRNETFCISAVEMEARGLPVVSRYRGDGLITTIANNITGFLRLSDREIANKIVLLLQETALAEKMGTAAVAYSRKFDIKNELHKWNELSNETVFCGTKSKMSYFEKPADIFGISIMSRFEKIKRELYERFSKRSS